MSDAALTGMSGNPPEQVKKDSLSHDTTTSSPTQTASATTNSAGGGSHVTTDGNVASSGDPTTRPDASIGEKLKGDVSGAIKGTVGSIQGAVGATIRNKDMEQAGLQKMSEEDQRLGAKRGVMPVGSDQRNTTSDGSAA